SSLTCYLHSFPTRRSSDLLFLEPQFGLMVNVQVQVPFGTGAQVIVPLNPPTTGGIGVGSGGAGGTPNSNAPRSHAPSEPRVTARSEEHTSELQSRGHLVCR